MIHPLESTSQPVPVSRNGAGLIFFQPAPQLRTTSDPTSAITRTVAGFARRMISCSVVASAARAARGIRVASRASETAKARERSMGRWPSDPLRLRDGRDGLGDGERRLGLPHGARVLDLGVPLGVMLLGLGDQALGVLEHGLALRGHLHAL